MADTCTPILVSSDDIETLQRRLRVLEHRCARLQDFADLASDWMWEIDAGYRFTLNDASVERTYPLTEVTAALGALESGQVRGKVALQIG